MSAPAPEPPPFVVLDDAVIEARRTLPSDALAYVEGGAEDERTLDENRRAFTRWFLRPRMLTGAPAADPSTTFLGMPLAMPILVAPFAGDTLLHADGYRAVLEAAASLGTLAVVPEVTGETLEALASAAPTRHASSSSACVTRTPCSSTCSTAPPMPNTARCA